MSKLLKAARLLTTLPAFVGRTALSSVGVTPKSAIYSVIPGANWATDWVSHYVTAEMQQRFQLPMYETTTPQFLTGHILHYCQLGEFLVSLGSVRNTRNRLVTTIFHGNLENVPDNIIRNTERFLGSADSLEMVVTTSEMMENRLITWGIPSSKIATIPIGIDLNHFEPIAAREKATLRESLGIPADAFCIGSFQKDGVGMDEGLVPKMIKGPDLFLDVMAQLRLEIPNLYVVLTGPARGFVKLGLEKLGIPYLHKNLPNYLDIARFYHLLDSYLVASREEGGPFAILESLASGVPLVSTRVGQAPDIVIQNESGILCQVEDVDAMTNGIKRIYGDRETARQLAAAGIERAAKFAWPEIGQQYYDKVYRPLLNPI